MRQFLLQMAGEPGAGKSTLARAIGEETGAVVLDKDVIKSAALNAGAPEDLAGPLAYEVFFAVARSFCSHGHSVVLDSPAFFPDIPEKGCQIAKDYDAAYFIVRCQSPLEELVSRLSERPAQASQWQGIASPVAYKAKLDAELSRRGVGELAFLHLTLDTTQPLQVCLEQALAYIGHDAG